MHFNHTQQLPPLASDPDDFLNDDLPVAPINTHAFNGYKNRETWYTLQYIINDAYTYRVAQELLKKHQFDIRAQWDTISSLVTDQVRNDSPALSPDLVICALARVCWAEVIKALDDIDSAMGRLRAATKNQ